MTWSCTHWEAMIRLRRSRALGGGVAPRAFSTARIEAMAWTVVQTPQMPLGEGPGVARVAALQDQLDAAEHRAGGPGVVDLPPSTSASIRRWPSIRVTGSTTTWVMAGLPSSVIGSGAGLPRPSRGRPGWCSACHQRWAREMKPWAAKAAPTPDRGPEADLVDAGGDAEAGHAREVLVEGRHLVPEVGLGAADARVAAADRPVGAAVPADVGQFWKVTGPLQPIL